MSATTWAALGWRLFLLTSGISHSSFHAATFVRFSVVYFHVSRAVAGEGLPESYLPKTCVHQWEGHTKVETLQFERSHFVDLLLFSGRQLHSMVTQVGSFVTQRLS